MSKYIVQKGFGIPAHQVGECQVLPARPQNSPGTFPHLYKILQKVFDCTEFMPTLLSRLAPELYLSKPEF